MNALGDHIHSRGLNFDIPGHWNDPVMLEVGNGATRDNEYQCTLKQTLTMQCLLALAAPLLAGAHLTEMTPATLAVLTNPEALAVDQDTLGIQARRVLQVGPLKSQSSLFVTGAKRFAGSIGNRASFPSKSAPRTFGRIARARTRSLGR